MNVAIVIKTIDNDPEKNANRSFKSPIHFNAKNKDPAAKMKNIKAIGLSLRIDVFIQIATSKNMQQPIAVFPNDAAIERSL